MDQSNPITVLVPRANSGTLDDVTRSLGTGRRGGNRYDALLEVAALKNPEEDPMIEQTLARWHRMLESGKLEELDELLTEDVVFWSPVVHSPQKGKVLTKMYLHAASAVFAGGDFSYRREVATQYSGDAFSIENIDLIDSRKLIIYSVIYLLRRAVTKTTRRLKIEPAVYYQVL